MSADNIRRMRLCPLCGKPYSGYPALSRKDNETLICPDCGTREALEELDISVEEREEIISTIHRFTDTSGKE